MKVVAKSVKGKEFFYNAESAHKVSDRSAWKIASALNNVHYDLKEGEVWHVHDVDEYDKAYLYGMAQAFVRRNGGLVRVW